MEFGQRNEQRNTYALEPKEENRLALNNPIYNSLMRHAAELSEFYVQIIYTQTSEVRNAHNYFRCFDLDKF
jgi:hypothetical protein